MFEVKDRILGLVKDKIKFYLDSFHTEFSMLIVIMEQNCFNFAHNIQNNIIE